MKECTAILHDWAKRGRGGVLLGMTAVAGSSTSPRNKLTVLLLYNLAYYFETQI